MSSPTVQMAGEPCHLPERMRLLRNAGNTGSDPRARRKIVGLASG
jgi:hypothetical protein